MTEKIINFVGDIAASLKFSHSSSWTLSFKVLTDEQHLHGHMTQFSCHGNGCHVNTLRNALIFGQCTTVLSFWTTCMPTVLVFKPLFCKKHLERRLLSNVPSHWNAWWVKTQGSTNLLKDILIGNMAAAGIKPSIRSGIPLTSRLPCYFQITVQPSHVILKKLAIKCDPGITTYSNQCAHTYKETSIYSIYVCVYLLDILLKDA